MQDVVRTAVQGFVFLPLDAAVVVVVAAQSLVVLAVTVTLSVVLQLVLDLVVVVWRYCPGGWGC